MDGSTDVAATGSVANARVAVGNDFACAITNGGTVMCWGDDIGGSLGSEGGTLTTCVSSILVCSLSPVEIEGLSNIVAVYAGGSTACALTASGGVSCWGLGHEGQLGNGSTQSSGPTPVPVTGLSSGVTTLSVGYQSVCAVTTGGGVMCWGQNTYGQLGNGSTTKSAVPVPVMGLSSGVTSVAVGYDSACALESSGAVVCWGDNIHGQLGNSVANSAVPVPVNGLSTGVSAIAMGDFFACAILQGQGVQCWGGTPLVPREAGVIPADTTPTTVPGLPVVAAISGGSNRACALTASGGILCWGTGILGNGMQPSAGAALVSVAGLTTGVTELSVGYVSACAINSDGAVVCWGDNSQGALGTGMATENSLVPVPVVGL